MSESWESLESKEGESTLHLETLRTVDQEFSIIASGLGLGGRAWAK